MKRVEIERQALELLDQAFSRASDQREAYIEGRDDLDRRVRQRALALLRTEASEASWLLPTGGSPVEDDETPPETIGAYRILRRIGRGGMGSVYLGERISGDFDHRVAIKIIRSGILSDALVDRFRRERQILARLNHPNIARLYDGGQTEEGAPFIVMEHVEGKSLARWIAEDLPTLEERLDLFAEVARAVFFAHQNLVIHRDLTPSNILITPAGQAKLIDFGIARPPAEGDDSDRPSKVESLSLTPGYAAPERSQGTAATTLSDIYSLGRILAEIVEEYGDAELQAIAARAARPDPADRYPSVEALLDDLQRHRSGRPVAAYSVARGYRLKRFVGRNAAAVAASVLLFLSLAIGLGATLWAYGRSEVARAEAVERFNDVRALSNYQLFDLYDRLSRVVGTTLARQELAGEAHRYLAKLADGPGADGEVRLENARAHIQLARIFGVPAQPNLGEFDLAEANLASARRLLEQFEPQTDAHRAGRDIAHASLNAAESLFYTHRRTDLERAKTLIASGYRALVRVPAPLRSPAWHLARRDLRYAEIDVRDLDGDSGRLRALANHLRREADTLPEIRDRDLRVGQDRAFATYVEALAAYVDTDHATAIPLFRAAHDAFSSVEARYPNAPMLLYLKAWNDYLGYGAVAQTDDMAGKQAFLDSARATAERLRSLEENDAAVGGLMNRLREANAQLLADRGRFDEAIAEQTAMVAHYDSRAVNTQASGPHADAAYARIILAFMYRDAGRAERACATLGEAQAILGPLSAAHDLSDFLEKAGQRIPARLESCRQGRPLGRMLTLFEGEG